MRTTAAAALIVLMTTACTAGKADRHTTAASPAAAATTSAGAKAADARLIGAMYADITRAFQVNPDDGVRKLVAFQDPQDRADVNFSRCVSAILPGAKTLPASKRFHFVPKITTMTPDPGYTLTSGRVRGLHPKGRIYLTEVMIDDGGKPTVHQRHQVVLAGRAFQFSAC